MSISLSSEHFHKHHADWVCNIINVGLKLDEVFKAGTKLGLDEVGKPGGGTLKAGDMDQPIVPLSHSSFQH